MNCETIKDLLVLLNCGELSFEEEETVESHVESCTACRAERQRLQRLDAFLELETTAVPSDLLARCRRDLRARLAREAPHRTWFSPVALWQSIGSIPWLKPTGALALLAVGFMSGRIGGGVSDRLMGPGPVQLSSAHSVSAQTGTPTEAEPTTASPEGSQVSYRPITQTQSAAEPNDARMRNLLLAAINDQDPALRVDSIDLLQHRCSDETVRRALLTALKSDKNSGVRLKALDALRPYAQNPETRVVLAGVVLNDNSPTIRAQAIDLLVQSRGTDVASTLQEVLRREENPYIRERSVNALRAMKASAGTF